MKFHAQIRKEAQAMKQIKIARTGYILVSVLCYLSGIFCILMPDIHTKAAAIAGGLILAIYGAVKITGYFSKDLYCLAFQHDFACGMFLIVLGIVVLFAGGKFNGYLLPGLGVLILLDSLLCIQTSVEAEKFGLSSWRMILASSILSGALAVALIITDSQTMAGCSLLAEGFMRHYIILHTISAPLDCQPSSKKKSFLTQR